MPHSVLSPAKNNYNDLEGEFRTTDMSLAATILHENCGFLSVDRTQHRAEFVFEDSEKLRDLVTQYWRNELMCPAQSLLASLKRTKHILYDSQ